MSRPIALVSGAGSGIGRATALALARDGHDLVVCGRRVEPLEETVGRIEALGAAAFAHPCDVREPEQVATLLDATEARFGRLDVLVNNAGGQFTAPAEEVSVNGWRAVHRLSVESVWSVTREAASRLMIPARSGVIVNIGFSPRRGIPGFVHASAARSALETLSSSLALEWSRYGIRAVTVAAGNIDTEGIRQYAGEEGEEAMLAAYARQVPLGRLGTPEDVAETIAFVASPRGGYITGTTIVVDGGLDAWGAGEAPPPLEM